METVYYFSIRCVWLTDQQDAVQKKTFTKWVNSFLVKVRHSVLVNCTCLVYELERLACYADFCVVYYMQQMIADE